MAKYSYEFKLKVVQAYLKGEGGYEYLTQKYDISHHSLIETWVKAYREFGKEGILRSRKNNNYNYLSTYIRPLRIAHWKFLYLGECLL